MRKNWYSCGFIIAVIVIDIDNNEPPCAISNKAGDDLARINGMRCDYRLDAVITVCNNGRFSNNAFGNDSINVPFKCH